MIKGANLSAQMGSNPLVGAGTAGLISVGSNLLNDGSFLGSPTSTIPGTGVKLDPVTGDPFSEIDPYALPTTQTGGSPGVELPSDAGTAWGNNAGIGNANIDFGATPAAIPSAGGLTQAATTTAAGAPSVAGVSSSGFKMADIATMGLLASLVAGKTPQQATDAIMQDPALTEQQKQGMLRKLTNYTLNYNKTTMPEQGTPEWDAFMTDLSQGKENVWANPTISENPPMAKGGRTKRQPQGALSQISRLSQGAGDGRSDSIEARLSDGEYVIDAETVALLGNGSTKAGAAMLDQMRQGVRQQKGRALAKGKFSPNAKSPLAYMKGGLR
jgi:hypothetical protein